MGTATYPEMPVRPARPAFTLFELILVLALLAILAALAVPSLDAMYGQYRLNAAVDQVRGAWATAKAHALEESVPYRFSIMPGGNSYRIAPDDPNDSNRSGGNGAPEDTANGPLILEENLPKGIQVSLTDTPGGPDSTPGNQAPPPAKGDSGMWVGVTVFLPDGTTRQDAQLLLQGTGAKSKVVRLRSLTGTVTVSDQGENGPP